MKKACIYVFFMAMCSCNSLRPPIEDLRLGATVEGEYEIAFSYIKSFGDYLDAQEVFPTVVAAKDAVFDAGKYDRVDVLILATTFIYTIPTQESYQSSVSNTEQPPPQKFSFLRGVNKPQILAAPTDFKKDPANDTLIFFFSNDKVSQVDLESFFQVSCISVTGKERLKHGRISLKFRPKGKDWQQIVGSSKIMWYD